MRNMSYIAYACLVGTSIFALGYYFFFGLFFSRLLLLWALVLSFVVTVVWHAIFEHILRHILRMPVPVFKVLIVGVTRESMALISLMNQKKNPLTPVAILDGAGTKEKEIDGVPVLGKLNKLEQTLVDYKITHLIQCSDMEQSLNLLSACRNLGITYMVLPSVFGIVERDERVESLEGKPVTSVSPKQELLRWLFQ
jgi:FlaA1/EpsC-like NDP-sugar epimerase